MSEWLAGLAVDPYLNTYLLFPAVSFAAARFALHYREPIFAIRAGLGGSLRAVGMRLAAMISLGGATLVLAGALLGLGLPAGAAEARRFPWSNLPVPPVFGVVLGLMIVMAGLWGAAMAVVIATCGSSQRVLLGGMLLTNVYAVVGFKAPGLATLPAPSSAFTFRPEMAAIAPWGPLLAVAGQLAVAGIILALRLRVADLLVRSWGALLPTLCAVLIGMACNAQRGHPALEIYYGVWAGLSVGSTPLPRYVLLALVCITPVVQWVIRLETRMSACGELEVLRFGSSARWLARQALNGCARSVVWFWIAAIASGILSLALAGGAVTPFRSPDQVRRELAMQVCLGALGQVALVLVTLTVRILARSASSAGMTIAGIVAVGYVAGPGGFPFAQQSLGLIAAARPLGAVARAWVLLLVITVFMGLLWGASAGGTLTALAEERT